LQPGTYSAIIANAYGIYYRPDSEALRRFHTMLAPQGILFVAIDPVTDIKHALVSPMATLIDRHIRPYRRISANAFKNMARRAGFRLWLETDYTPAPDWKRKALFLIKE
jgi:hypothetical protein